jgi:Predicted HD-superfamily hydrolase
MAQRTLKEELEEYLGNGVSNEFYEACMAAFIMGRHGPAGLGGSAVLGYFIPFEDVLGHHFRDHSCWPCSEAISLGGFFSRDEERRKEIRKRLEMERMTKEITEDSKRFKDILSATGREGIDYVIEELETLGFFAAPASASHHLNVEGGLVKHSLNVYDEAMMIRTQQIAMRPEIAEYIPEDSVAIAALLHDVCKAEIYRKTVRSRKMIDGSWEKYDSWEVDQNTFPCGHGEKSVIQLLRWGLDMTDDEILAIRWHMGPWDLAFQSFEQKGCLNTAKDTTPLLCLVQTADSLASNMLESRLTNR